jgi:hypothetical protein
MMVLSPILIVVVGQGIFGRRIRCSIDARYCTILLGEVPCVRGSSNLLIRRRD